VADESVTNAADDAASERVATMWDCKKNNRSILTQIKRARLLLKEIEAHYKRVLELARLRPSGSIRVVVLAVVGSAERNSPLVPAALRVSMMCQRRVGQLLKEA
jgi:hypothetical protein